VGKWGSDRIRGIAPGPHGPHKTPKVTCVVMCSHCYIHKVRPITVLLFLKLFFLFDNEEMGIATVVRPDRMKQLQESCRTIVH